MTIAKQQEGRSNSVISTQSHRRRSSWFGNEKELGKTEIAVVGFESSGTKIEIVHKGRSYVQILSLSERSTKVHVFMIDAEEHQWRPLGPSRSVLELVGRREQRIALFLYAGDETPGNGVGNPRRVSLGVRHSVGELHMLIDADEVTELHEEVLLSAVAVVESKRVSW